MNTIASAYPEGLKAAVQTTPEELQAQILLVADLTMLEPGKFSSGKVAELTGLSRIEFLQMCGL